MTPRANQTILGVVFLAALALVAVAVCVSGGSNGTTEPEPPIVADDDDDSSADDDDSSAEAPATP